MKYIKKTFLPLFIILLTFVMLFVFRVVPGGKLWNNYSVLYVDSSVSESRVLDLLKESGCSQIISLSSQTAPFLSSITPVLPSLFNEYLNKRLNYFYDKDKDYKLYYVKKAQKAYLDDALAKINKNLTEKAGIDISSGYPLIVPSVTFVFFIFLLIFSFNKVLFALSSLMMILFSFAVPFYSTACGVIIWMTFSFICQKLWKRKGSLKRILTNFYIRLLAFIALLSIILTSVTSALLGLLSVLSSVCLVYFYYRFTCFLDSRLTFNYLPVFSASQISLFSKKSLKKIIAAPFFILLLFIFFISDSSFARVKSSSNIFLPSPVENKEKADESLPVTEDFYQWSWNLTAFPYRNLNKESFYSKPLPKEKVFIPSYKNTAEGIVEYSKTYLTYDENFLNEIDVQVKEAENDIIEKLFIEQGRNFNCGFTSSAKSKKENFTWSLILMLISAMVVPVIFLFQSFSGRNK